MKNTKLIFFFVFITLSGIVHFGFASNQTIKQAKMPTVQQLKQMDRVKMELEKLKTEIRLMKAEIKILKTDLSAYQKVIKISGPSLTIETAGVLNLKGALVIINKDMPLLMSKGATLLMSMHPGVTIGLAGPYKVVSLPSPIKFTIIK